MNILHINSYYVGSNLYKNFYKELDRKNVKQKIYVPVKDDKDINKNYIDLNYGEFLYFNTFNYIDRILYFTKINKSYNKLMKIVKLENFDLIHAHSLFVNGGLANKLFNKYGLKYIVLVQNTDINFFYKRLFHLRKKGLKILLDAEKIIFMTPSYSKRLINNYIPNNKKKEIEDKSVIIPSGINNYWLKNLKYRQNYLINKKIRLIYAGRIDKNKNVLNICKVVKELNSQNFKVELTIIGKGPQKEKIEKYVSNYDSIKVLYYMPKEELIEYFRISDIFIMPSYTETFGLVYIEAMSQGLPIIYTKNEGVDGYFKEGTVGYRVNPNNINDMVDKIKLIYNNYIQMSKNAVRESQRFFWNKISNRYIKMYKELI